MRRGLKISPKFSIYSYLHLRHIFKKKKKIVQKNYFLTAVFILSICSLFFFFLYVCLFHKMFFFIQFCRFSVIDAFSYLGPVHCHAYHFFLFIFFVCLFKKQTLLFVFFCFFVKKKKIENIKSNLRLVTKSILLANRSGRIR